VSATTTYPIGTIAKLLLLTERRVQQLTEKDVIPKAERGRYELAPAVQGYIRFLRDRALKGDAEEADEGENVKLKRAKRRAAEVVAARLEESVIAKEPTLQRIRELAQGERDAILAWPARAAPLLAADLGVDQHNLQAAIDASLRAHLADRAEPVLEA
jgi:hypothetical protein